MHNEVFSIFVGCETQADVTFILDSSDSVGQTNFGTQLDFAKSIVNKLDISPGRTQIGTVTFSSTANNQFNLNQYNNKNDVLNAISGIRYTPGSTHTGTAIKYVTQQSFTPLHGARTNVPHIAVLITNGPSFTKDITKIEAKTAKDNNVVIYAIGVGGGIDRDELMSVSSSPNSRYFMTADNYQTLNTLSDLLAAKICNGKLYN